MRQFVYTEFTSFRRVFTPVYTCLQQNAYGNIQSMRKEAAQ
nr:MAG TPA: hypothetical protein [Caudoviricetes sp.]